MEAEAIGKAKRELKRKFSYAKHLDDSNVFTEDMLAVLIEYQGKKNASGYKPPLRTDGVLDYATQKALGTIPSEQPAPAKVGTLFTAQGTGVDMWTGLPADTARAVEGDWEWQPIGNYPADPFPMWPSIWKGIEELRFQIRRHAELKPGSKIALAGYSQGAVVISWVWKWDIEHPNGMLHDLLPNVVAAVTWGNPMREYRVANGNRFAGWPVPEGRGIYKDRLERTPTWWLDFAHGGNSQWGRDLYTDSPNNHTGDIQTAVCDVVMMADLFTAFNMLFVHVGHLSDNPAAEIPPIFDAVVQAGMFFVPQGTMPHLDYDIRPAVEYLRGVANGLRAKAA